MNRKGKNFFLLLQLFVSFTALFVFVGLNLKKFSNYFKPLGYNYENVWLLDLKLENVTEQQESALLETIKQKLKSIPELDVVSSAVPVPFYQWGKEQNLKYMKQASKAIAFEVDDHYKDVLDLEIIKGRWFSSVDNASGTLPIVITKDLAEREFGSEDPLGKRILIEEKPAIVIGVSETFKENTSSDVIPGFFKRLDEGHLVPRFVLKSTQADNIQLLESKIKKELLSIPGSISIVKSEPLVWVKKYAHKLDYIQLSIALIVFAFLVINIFLGVSGVFTYNLSRRKAEVGLRVAMGASALDILKQFLGETIVLTTLGILPGLIIAIQLLLMQYFEPYMNAYYGTLSIICSALFIYLLMLSCAFYPSLKAAKVQPADALHED